MRVVIAGGTGFIGRALGRRLVDHEIVRVARPERDDLGPVVSVDLLSGRGIDRLPDHADAIVHLVTARRQDRPLTAGAELVDQRSAELLAEYARRAGASRFILVSSGNVYGFGRGARTESDARRGSDRYAREKQRAEDVALALQSSLVPTVVRLSTPYGPGQRDRLVPDLIRRVAACTPIDLAPDGEPHLNPIYIEDVVDVLDALLVRRDAPLVLNVAGPEVVSIDELARVIGDVVGRRPTFRAAPPASGDLILDITLLTRFLGGPPRRSVREGLRLTIRRDPQLVSLDAIDGRPRHPCGR